MTNGTPTAISEIDIDLIKEVVEQPLDDVIGELAAFASDKRYSPEHKAETIRTMTADAKSRLQTDYERKLSDLEGEIKRLQQQAQVSPVPPAEEVGQLNYVRDTMIQQWKGQDVFAIANGWQAALDSGDKVAIRVYADFAEAELRSRKYPGATGNLPAQYKVLQDKTADVLHPGTRQAKERIATLQKTIPILKKSAATALRQLESTRFDVQGGRANTTKRSLFRL